LPGDAFETVEAPYRKTVTTIGILALQGDFEKHAHTLRGLNVAPKEIRDPTDLQHIAGLVLPGGESTTMGKLMDRFSLMEPIRKLIREGMPVFGTCAGMILLAREIEDLEQPGLRTMDIRVRRNAYGPQIESFETDIHTEIEDFPVVRGVFIRAPVVTRIGVHVEVLATHEGTPVILRENNMLAASFHPELTEDTRIHEYFLQMVFI
jgi:pyridoxal 5'-phosphate synthase pdxT subunit